MKKIVQGLKETLKYFFVITVLILIAATFYISVFYGPEAAVQVVFLWQIILVSFLSSLSWLIFYTGKNRTIGKREYRLRWGLCYVYVNVVNLGLGLLFGWFELSNLPMVAGMLFCIFVVYVAVALVVYLVDARTTQEINQRLQERYGGSEEED